VSASFSENYDLVYILFGIAPDVSHITTCEDMFEAETIAKFGTNPDCVWDPAVN
jgi:hypothetical protein